MHNFAMLASASALVLTEKEINEEGPLYVRLKGRRGGFIAWFLTLLGIDVWTEFNVYADHIELRAGSISGKLNDLYPISSVSNLGTGMIKPFLFMVNAIIFGIFALVCLIAAIAGLGGTGWLGLVVCLAITAVCIFNYKMGRTMMVYVITDGGTIGSVFVKRSLIENKTLSEEEIDHIIAILTKLVREKH